MTECFECGRKDELHDHHVVPKSLGGMKTVKLCPKCHGYVHDRNLLTHKELQKKGIQRARIKGVIFGRPRALPDKKYNELVGDIMFIGSTNKELIRKYKISEPTLRRYKKEIRDND